MKFLLLIALTFLGFQAAVAQTSECSTVPKANDRLDCYDRAMPQSVTKSVMSKQKTAAPTTLRDRGKTVDALAVENSKLDANLKMICRGC
jgi:hypothetical protein